MACAVSTLTATPRDVNCGEMGAVAKMAAANSKPIIDPVLIAFLLMFTTSAQSKQQSHRERDKHTPAVLVETTLRLRLARPWPSGKCPWELAPQEVSAAGNQESGCP